MTIWIKIRNRLYASWYELCAGSFRLELKYPSGALAYTLLADQFSRNVFNGHKNAFVHDRIGAAAAESSVKRVRVCWLVNPPNLFFSSSADAFRKPADEDRYVRLVLGRVAQTGASALVRTKVHREIIRKFWLLPLYQWCIWTAWDCSRVWTYH